jgi:putative DNA primase/helicase
VDGEGRKGLKIPESVMQQTQEYRQDEDLIARFLTQGCIQRGDALWRDGVDARVSSRDLFHSFIAWAEQDGESFAAKMTHTSFGRALSDRGFRAVRTRTGERGYEGIIPFGSIRTKVLGDFE